MMGRGNLEPEPDSSDDGEADEQEDTVAGERRPPSARRPSAPPLASRVPRRPPSGRSPTAPPQRKPQPATSPGRTDRDELEQLPTVKGESRAEGAAAEATVRERAGQSGLGVTLSTTTSTMALSYTPQGLSKYELLDELGRGGLGVVRLALDPVLRRHVAIKSLHRGEKEKERAVFVQEAQVTGQLEHPNIVPVHELGISETGDAYFSMKQVRGETLRKRIQQARKVLLNGGDPEEVFPLRERLEVMRKVLDALGYAHSRGVIHRDIKPENIMLGGHGEVLVMDWGLARIVGEQQRLNEEVRVRSDRDDAGTFETQVGSVAGTPAYMSPEQAKGEVDKLDPRSDIFAAGCLLYELLTFAAPYEGDSLHEVLTQAARVEWKPVRQRGRELTGRRGKAVPKDLASIAEKAMSRHARRRYATALGMRTDLDAWAEGKPTSARTWNPIERSLKWSQRHPASVLASALLLVFGLVLAVLLSQMDAQTQARLLAEERAARETAERKQADERAARERAEREQAVAEREQAEERAAREKADRQRAEAEARMSRAAEAAARGELEQVRHELERESRGHVAEVAAEFAALWQEKQARNLSDEEFREELGARLSAYLAAFDRLIEDVAPLTELELTHEDYFHRAFLRRFTDNFEGALKDYGRAIELVDEDNALYHYNRGLVHQALGQLELAVEDYSRALEVDPHYKLALNNRGNARQDLEDFAGALADYEQVLELDPNDVLARINRGNMRRMAGNFYAALEDYNHALRQDPTNATAYHNRATTYHLKRNFLAAVADYELALEYQPSNWQSWAGRAGALLALDREEAALESLKQAYRHCNNPAARREIAEGIQDLGGALPD